MQVEGDKYKKTSFQMQRIQPASGASMKFQSWLRKHVIVPKKRITCKRKNTSVNASVVVPFLDFSFKMWPNYVHPMECALHGHLEASANAIPGQEVRGVLLVETKVSKVLEGIIT